MKGKLLSGVAAIAFGLGMATTGPALAFSEVDWDWYKNKYQTVDINTWVWSFFHPEGETEVQKTQIYVGDVSAYANLQGNYVPQQLVIEGGTIEVPYSGSADFDLYYDSFPPQAFAGDGTVSGDLDAASVSGNADENWDHLVFTVDVSGTTSIEIEGYIQDLAQAAVDGLGHAVQDVSAIGIADTIDSAFPVYAHETQILLGAEDLNSIEPEGDNFLGNVAMDLIRKSNITAMATAGAWYNPVEIAIDQDVSAVAAALSINLESDNAPSLIQTVNADEGWFGDSGVDTGDTIVENRCNFCSPEYGVFYPVLTNNIVEADITQFAYADVVASAMAYQDLTAFTNLGAYNRLGERGLVSSQSVQAAGLVASITNKVKAVAP